MYKLVRAVLAHCGFTREVPCRNIDLHPVQSGPMFVKPIHYCDD